MFAKTIQNFSNNLDTLRDFVNLVRPVLQKVHDEEIKSNPKAFMPLVFALEAIAPEMLVSDAELANTINSLKSEFASKLNLEVKEKENRKTVNIHIEASDGEAFFKGMQSLSKRLNQIGLLYQNALISLVSAAEWFLSQLLHHYFDLYPDAAGVRDRSLTLSDLQAIGSIEDARTYLIELKIEELMRGSFNDWVHFLKNTLKLQIDYLSVEEGRLTEVYQRRNLLIHNGGVVNKIYMNKVPSSVRPGLKLGDSIKISQEYLDEAIDRFERFFLLVALELWKKIAQNDIDRAQIVTEIALRHLGEERWHIAEGLNLFLVNDKKLPERERLIGKINYWQSLKWANQFEKVRQEIENEDFSAKDEVFTLAKAALLDDERRFLELLPKLLEVGKVTETDLYEWPLFRSMRETDGFKSKYAGKTSYGGVEDNTAELEPNCSTPDEMSVET
uniref:Uncharacterized protein n=1 Tax=Cyanothece sp. (strain PCC 7425 / ATCC 29141) TaxID=395961 RepID=B8HNJ5_CYAP4